MPGGLKYIPSPIAFDYDVAYSALANSSGRMQYYMEVKGGNRTRIGRHEFIRAYNNNPIVALQPVPARAQVFQLHFFVKLPA